MPVDSSSPSTHPVDPTDHLFLAFLHVLLAMSQHPIWEDTLCSNTGHAYQKVGCPHTFLTLSIPPDRVFWVIPSAATENQLQPPISNVHVSCGSHRLSPLSSSSHILQYQQVLPMNTMWNRTEKQATNG